jgi:hypothetical protein
MKIDPARLLAPLLALLLLAAVLQQTVSALRSGGVWGHVATQERVASPYTRLEALLRPVPADSTPGRDPFAFGRAPAPAPAPRGPAAPRPAAPPPAPERPVLTSIVWAEGANPSATLRWQGHDITVQVDKLFDVFRVRSITRDQVILERGAEILVLQRPQKGDSA